MSEASKVDCDASKWFTNLMILPIIKSTALKPHYILTTGFLYYSIVVKPKSRTLLHVLSGVGSSFSSTAALPHYNYRLCVYRTGPIGHFRRTNENTPTVHANDSDLHFSFLGSKSPPNNIILSGWSLKTEKRRNENP